MKKVILGSAMLLAGTLADALLLAAAATLEWQVGDRFSALGNLERYGLTPALWLFAALAAVGLALALWGLVSKGR